MDSEMKWVIGGFFVFFGMLIGGASYDEHLKHTEKMECMKLKGEWVGKGCIFREQKQ